jgi:hypothetical protein
MARLTRGVVHYLATWKGTLYAKVGMKSQGMHGPSFPVYDGFGEVDGL